MTVQITIIGTGQIGTSIGLALAGKNAQVRRTGHDRELSISRRAEKLGAFDRVEINLIQSVKDADLVILAIPIDQVYSTLQLIAPEIREGAVVMDTAPVKEIVLAWAGELLPAGRHYVGLIPVIGPAFLEKPERGVEAANAELFKGGLLGIVAPPRSNTEAIKLAADLAALLGASPLFADGLELDGLMAATYLLPQIAATALLNTTVDQPGWFEARKLAGSAFTEGTGPVLEQSVEAQRSALLMNRENVLRLVDRYIEMLQKVREEIDAEDQAALDRRLASAHRGRELWWRQRQVANWAEVDAVAAPDMPASGDFFGRLFGIRRKPQK